MYAFSAVQDRVLTLLPPRGLVADAVAVQYTSPAIVLGDVARLQYLIGELRYQVALSAADAAGVLVLSVKHGVEVLGATTINMNGTADYAGSFGVSINALQGADQITLEAEVTAPAGVGVTFDLGAVLSVTVPLTVGG